MGIVILKSNSIIRFFVVFEDKKKWQHFPVNVRVKMRNLFFTLWLAISSNFQLALQYSTQVCIVKLFERLHFNTSITNE